MTIIRTLKMRLVLTTLCAVAALTACGPSKPEAAKSAADLSGAVSVKVASVVRQTISEKLTYTGTLEPWRKINITPEMGGKVARIDVEEGQAVAEGQVLAELETKSITLQFQQAEAGQAVAEANFNNTAKNKERMDRLAAQKAVSEQQYEQVKLAYDAAKAQVDQARAAVALARHALDTAVMKAPWAGLIASKNAQVGDVINPMMGGLGPVTGVVTLIDDSRIKVVVEVAQADILRLAKGRPAVLFTAGGDSAGHAGFVTVVNRTADPLSKKFRVEVQVDNRDRVIRPGTFGTVVFEIQSRENALAVPQKAVLEDKYVFVVEGGKAVRREAVFGLRNTTMIEVLGGLTEGEQVVIEGNYGLIEGSPVEIKR